MSGTKKRVIVFQRCLLHYRKGVFETIAASDEFDYTFCFGEDEADLSDDQATGHLGYPTRFSRIWEWRLPGMKSPLFFQRAEIRAALGREFDVLIYWADLHFVSFAVGSIIARLRRKKVVHWGIGMSYGPTRGGVVWWFRRQVMKLANAVLLYGPREYETYKRSGVDVSNVFIAYNALDARPARRLAASLTDDDLRRFRQERGLGEHHVMVFCGRLIRRKRVPELVTAMPAILAAVPDAKLVIIGDGPEAGRVRDEIRRLGLGHAVSMPGAIFDDAALAMYYLNSDVAVCAGQMGLMINQAFMYGVPVLTTDDTWKHGPEVALMEPDKTGIFYEDGNLASLADCAVGLLLNREKLETMRQCCLNTIAERFNERVMARQFDEAVRYALCH